MITENKKNTVGKNDRGWHKNKKIDWNTGFNKNVYQNSLWGNKSNESYLNQSTIERSLLIHCQINLVKFVESNKFGKVCSNIWDIFVWSIF